MSRVFYAKWLVITLCVVAISFTTAMLLFMYQIPVNPYKPYAYKTDVFEVAKFKSEQEFMDYLSKSENLYGDFFSLGAMGGMRVTSSPTMGGLDNFGNTTNLGVPRPLLPNFMAGEMTGSADIGSPSRVSETNVQVLGIDEPDILKTDGKQMYVASPQYYYSTSRTMPMMEMDIGIAPPEFRGGIKTVKIWPPAELELISDIDVTGDLLLVQNNLLVFTYDKLIAYDVSNPQEPKKTWEIKYNDHSQLVSARLYDGQVYMVSRTNVSYDRPCPIEPFSLDGRTISVPCSNIYYPRNYVPVDVTYTVSVVDPATGEMSQSNSFIGSSDSSVVYMSGENIYVTYSFPGDVVDFIYNMMLENKDIFPEVLIEKIAKLRTYDLSLESKMTEVFSQLDRWMAGLNSDEELRIENELQNRMEKYASRHKRELESTGIVKIKTSDLSVEATGSVPGQPLNQFSLDENNSYLRIATTIGSGMFGMFGGESVSDVYILDNSLITVGSVQDMGKGERIFSVRFVGSMGYVVTFRQTDPFYVLDLSNPTNPQLKGELKIPGFSSYLHPLSDNRILGVGSEGSRVKLSLFDVSDPSNPVEADKYLLDDYNSEVSQTHHAFLQDPRHSVFFIPGSRGGYVFSYKDDKLSLTTAISDISARRALYLNDYLYIVGNEKLVVLNENTWQKINELDIR